MLSPLVTQCQECSSWDEPKQGPQARLLRAAGVCPCTKSLLGPRPVFALV